jgi:hypothetical protein
MKSDKKLFTFRIFDDCWCMSVRTGGTGTDTHCNVSEAGGMNYEALLREEEEKKTTPSASRRKSAAAWSLDR